MAGGAAPARVGAPPLVVPVHRVLNTVLAAWCGTSGCILPSDRGAAGRDAAAAAVAVVAAGAGRSPADQCSQV